MRPFLRLAIGLLCLACLSLNAARLITATPATTELVFQLGRGADLVGASVFSDYPEAAKKLPPIGTLTMPSIERVLHLAPTEVVLDDLVPTPLFEIALGALKIPSFHFHLLTVKDLFEQSRRFLRTVYQVNESPAVDRYERCLSHLSAPSSFRFLAFAWFTPNFLFGHSSFLSDLISRVGGQNALPENWRAPYPQVAEDWILAHPVDTVYFIDQYPGDAEHAKLEVTRWWPDRKVTLIALPGAAFSRTSFTPLDHLLSLRPSPGVQAYDRCLRGKTR